MVSQLVKASTVRGKQIDVESYIIVSLELALLKARHGEWTAAGKIIDGLWSPFMALELEKGG